MADHSHIAKNTIILFIRMIILVIVSLYTSRIVLSALGVDDYGIYNVVGSIVLSLGFFNGTLNTVASRYITVALNSNDLTRQTKVFTNIMYVCLFISLLIVILCETIGIWFINNKLNIPLDKISIATSVLHLSVATIFINILSIPYNATIIAHEKMSAFAYISLFDAFGKLSIAFYLQSLPANRLFSYALLLFLIQVFDQIVYIIYCRKNFQMARIKDWIDKPLFRDIMRFMSWSTYGSIVSVGFTQGLNVLLNIFFGAAVNAARGIAVQVQTILYNFTLNFQTAINPQLIKSVDKHDNKTATTLLTASSKFSFFLLCALGMPIIAITPSLLNLWLEIVPEHTIQFVQIMIIIIIWSSLANPLRIINQAEGNIRKFQLYECSLLILIVPISYIALKLGYPAISVFIIHLCIELIAQIIRICIVLPKINVSKTRYIQEIILKILPIFFIPSILIIFLYKPYPISIINAIFIIAIVELTILAVIWMIGLTSIERDFIKGKLSSKISNLWTKH